MLYEASVKTPWTGALMRPLAAPLADIVGSERETMPHGAHTDHSAMSIRPVRPADFSAVLEIYSHYVESTVVTFDEVTPTLDEATATWSARLEAGLPFIVLEDDSSLVRGFASVHPFRDKSAFRHTVELSIYLHQDHTGQGFGTALLHAIMERSREAGFRTMVAVISDHEADASLALHRRFGFEEVGRMPHIGEKFGRSVGIILLQKSLESDAL